MIDSDVLIFLESLLSIKIMKINATDWSECYQMVNNTTEIQFIQGFLSVKWIEIIPNAHKSFMESRDTTVWVHVTINNDCMHRL